MPPSSHTIARPTNSCTTAGFFLRANFETPTLSSNLLKRWCDTVARVSRWRLRLPAPNRACSLPIVVFCRCDPRLGPAASAIAELVVLVCVVVARLKKPAAFACQGSICELTECVPSALRALAARSPVSFEMDAMGPIPGVEVAQVRLAHSLGVCFASSVTHRACATPLHEQSPASPIASRRAQKTFASADETKWPFTPTTKGHGDVNSAATKEARRHDRPRRCSVQQRTVRTAHPRAPHATRHFLCVVLMCFGG
jgi:hypothetical protein